MSYYSQKLDDGYLLSIHGLDFDLIKTAALFTNRAIKIYCTKNATYLWEKDYRRKINELCEIAKKDGNKCKTKSTWQQEREDSDIEGANQSFEKVCAIVH